MNEEILIVLGVLIALWFIWMIFIPLFVITENFIEKRIRKTNTSKKIARKLKGKTKYQTLRKVYDYINKTYYGQGHVFDHNAFLEALDYSISERLLLRRKRFLWCTNQLALLTSLLINTGQFTKEEIALKSTLGRTLSAHFYSVVNIKNKRFKIDPYYNIFKSVK